VLNLEDFYWPGQAAQVISANSSHRVTVDYLRRLAMYGVLTPVNIHGRNLYKKEEVDRVVVRKKRQGSQNSSVA
jgi:hypothetical protein